MAASSVPCTAGQSRAAINPAVLLIRPLRMTRATGFRRRQSWNTLAGQGRRRITVSATMQHFWISSVGTAATRATRLVPWTRSCPILGACTTCTETCASGAGTGTTGATINGRLVSIRSVSDGTWTGCFGAGAGTEPRAGAGRRAGTGSRPRTGPTPWGSEWPGSSPVGESGRGSLYRR
jgi:hypothetical protein